MRVLHVISGIDPSEGGPAAALAGMAIAQHSAGLNVAVAATFRAGYDTTIAESLQAAGVEVGMIGPARGPLCRHADLRPALRLMMEASDIVHIHALWEEIQHQAARAAARLRLPYVITPHGMLDPWSLKRAALKKRIYMMWRLRANLDAARAIHFTSRMEQELTRPLNLRAPGIVETLGVDLSEFEPLPERGSFRSRYVAIGDRPLVVFLGRLHPGKGLERLVEALAAMRNQDAVLAIVGPDADGHRAAIEALVAQKRLGSRVVFTGMLRGQNRIAALADADLFCLPSDHENFGVVVVEALAAGTPVIISDQVAICEEIKSAGVGGVVPARSDALAAELDRWCAQEDMRLIASERARPFARQHYDWNGIGRRWVGHYSRITADPEAATLAAGVPKDSIP